MTSRVALGAQESLQHRGGAPAYAPVWRAANPQQGLQDSAVGTEHERPTEDRPSQAKPRARPVQLDGIQTASSDGVRAPPRGRPLMFFSYGEDGSGTDLSGAGPTTTHLPVPPRPGSSAPGDTRQQIRIIPGGTGVKGDPAPVKPIGPDSPTPGAVLPGGKVADLFPWTGNQPEDVLSETLVKSGISNKSQIMNETNTARPSLWANLKNKSGTSTLSTLFVAVLEKRQSCSRLTAPNTFKPPPRLTLRDSTRETWLHDLANPNVGLRRLSRTVPHSITGKVLLEQCLNKSIPIPRAMWLAKCVGINEMRAHRRKGQAGATTWVRGWTSSVEQFLEGIVAAIGQHEWKSRITYALQLATHLFKEHLLEEDHFIDWVLNSLDSCPLERLFLWLLITCIPDFWHGLTSSRRRGKRLAESLLSHAGKLYGKDGEIREMPVLTFLESILAKVAVTKPACLLLPGAWERHGAVLSTFAQRRSNSTISRAVNEIDRRNKEVMRASSVGLSTFEASVGNLYRLLDAMDYTAGFSVNDLAFDCMDIIPDSNCLVSAVLQWASSLYRQGSHRLYLATRLLRKWSHVGVDIYEGILAYISRLASYSSKDPQLVFRVIAELVRSKTFSLGRYLQWLIASGSLNQQPSPGMAPGWPLRLLIEVPLTGLSEHVYNLRSTLLRDSPYSVETEELLIANTEEVICRQLPSIFGTNIETDSPAPIEFEGLSQTVRLEAAIWLREQVAATVQQLDGFPVKDPNDSTATTVCRISRHDFCTVRKYLEKFDDLSILADVIGIVATSFDSNVLSATADTLRHHFEAFKAIGAFDPLFERIAYRYTTIRTLRFPEKDLLLSLNALSRVTRVDQHFSQFVYEDLSRYDLKNSLAACSPVSDTMIESVTALGPEDEIERILSSGTSMDQQTMGRIFTKVASYLEEGLHKATFSSELLANWFYRLRNFEETAFDTIVMTWLKSLLMNHKQHLLSTVLPPLVASGCLSMPRFQKMIQECVRGRKPSQPAEAFRIAVEGLDNLLPNQDLDDFGNQQYSYYFRTEQRDFCRKHDSNLLGLVKEIFELDSALPNTACGKQFSLFLSSGRLLDVIRHAAIFNCQNLSFLMEIGRHASLDATAAHVKLLLDRLLDPYNTLHLSQMSFKQQITAIFQHTDQLSLPFCQLKLQHLFIMSAADASDSPESIATALIDALETALGQDHPYWLDLVSGLDTGLKNAVQEHAEQEILKNSAFLCELSTENVNAHHLDEPTVIRRYLNLIYDTASGTTRESPASLVVSLVERFKAIFEALNRIHNELSACNQTERFERHSRTAKLFSWLDILLRFALVRSPGLVLKASHQHQAALMWSLRSLLAHPCLESFALVQQYVFDVATLLSDYISEDVRKYLTRLDMAKCGADNRYLFIFGAIPQVDGWLGLTKPAPATGASQAGSSPQGQPQTPSSTSQNQQQQNTNIMPPLSRSMSQQHYQQVQGQVQGRGLQYQQNQQAHKALAQQLQRAASQGSQNSQLQQMQQFQHMQSMGQQRQMSMSANQQQRMASTPASALSQTSVGKSGGTRPEKVDVHPVPFVLNRWEILPESGGNPTANETAISLNLFGARRV